MMAIMSCAVRAGAEVEDSAAPATSMSRRFVAPSELLVDGQTASHDATGTGIACTDLSYRLLKPMTAKVHVTQEEREEEARIWTKAHMADRDRRGMMGHCEFNFPAAFAPLPEARDDASAVNGPPGANSTRKVSKWRQEYEERKQIRKWFDEQQIKAYQRMFEWQDRMFGPDRSDS